MESLRARRLLIAAMVLAMVAAACGDDDSGGTAPSTGSTASPTTESSVPLLPDEPNPASIDIDLDSSSAVVATIGFAGGSLQATGADGTLFELTVPEGALFSDVEITMTPIASAFGDAIGDTFLAGVDLEPSGLQFLQLVTLEIAFAGADENSLAFGAESGGGDLHLTPSEASPGSVVIGITHFSDYGIAGEGLGALIEDLVPVGHRARAAHELARGGSRHALDAAKRYADSLEQNTPAAFSEWTGWTAEIMSLLLRVSENTARHGWTVETPGFQDLLDSLQALIDAWFVQSDAQAQAVEGRCSSGDIDAFFELTMVTRVSAWMSAGLGVNRPESDAWAMTASSCLRLGVLWQADVLTTGTGDNAAFYSDISVAAEIPPTSLFPQALGLIGFLTQDSGPGEFELDIDEIDAPLTVDYIDGFWHDTCVPRPGSARMGLTTSMSIPNVGVGSGQFGDMEVSISIVEDVFIDCSQGFSFPADAQLPFHGGALRELNSDREGPEGWTFQLGIDPGGGSVAQLDEEVDTLSWSEGQYELRQLLTVYSGAG